MIYTPASNSNLLRVPVTGKNLPGKSPTVPSYSPPLKKSIQDPGKSIIIVWIMIGILSAAILGIAGGMIASSQVDAPQNVAKKQIEDIKKGQLQEAYGLFTNDTRSQLTLQTFSSMAYIAMLKDKGAGIRFLDHDIREATADLTGEIDVGSRKIPITYMLVKVGTFWQIRNISFY